MSVHHIRGKFKHTIVQHVASLGTAFVQSKICEKTWPGHRTAFAVACPVLLEQICMRPFCISHLVTCVKTWRS